MGRGEEGRGREWQGLRLGPGKGARVKGVANGEEGMQERGCMSERWFCLAGCTAAFHLLAALG